MVAPAVFALVGSLTVVLSVTIMATFYAVRRARKPTTPKEPEAQKEAEEKVPMTFTPQQLRTFTSNFSTKLGSGGFGVVYKGHFPDGTNIAVKVLTKRSNKKTEQELAAEATTISKTRHANLVKLYGLCNDPSMAALVMEYMEKGSLDNYLFGDEKGAMEWEKLRGIAIGTARGVAYLHEECHPRIIHYDIKPGNILLDADFVPKVADFGLARLCNKDNSHDPVAGYRGTPGYSAPEFLLNNYPVTNKCDVYSFGMVLFEIIGRRRNASLGSSSTRSLDWFPKRVWDGYDRGELATMLASPGGDAERMCKVALWCVQDSPDCRPQMSVVVKMLEGVVEASAPPMPFQYLYAMPSESTSSYVTSNGASYLDSEAIGL